MTPLVRLRLRPFAHGVLAVCRSTGHIGWPYRHIEGWRWQLKVFDLEYMSMIEKEAD